MVVKDIESVDQWKEIIGGEKPVVVDFYATWCAPCKAISPMLDKMSDAAEHSNISFVKVDVDKHPTIAQENAIRAMPTFLFFKGGKMNEKPVQGANPRALTELVAKAKAAGETQTGQASSS